jgi:hypothetical protein
MFYYEHPSEEGEVFRVFKRQSVAIFDHMFTQDVYIWKSRASLWPAVEVDWSWTIDSTPPQPADQDTWGRDDRRVCLAICLLPLQL